MTPSHLMPSIRVRPSAAGLAATVAIAAAAVAGCGSSSSSSKKASTSTTSTSASTNAGTTVADGYTTRVFASGVPVTFSTSKGPASVNQPDDIANLGSNIFVGFQNGVGPKGETMQGIKDSTVVEFSSSGSPMNKWVIAGHVDGLAGDPATGKVIATVNEDGNSSLFVIDPSSSQAVQYTYPPLPHNGGTDAVSFWQGTMLISASAPGGTGKPAPQASYPAVYVATLNASNHTVGMRSLFGDEASATKANGSAGGTTHLALTDPDTNTEVPSSAQRFGGQFVLSSQGDLQQIFASSPTSPKLSLLKLSQSIDDFVWPTSASGSLYVTDSSADLIYKITGPFTAGSEIAGVTPCNANSAPTACPAPGYGNNYLGQVDQNTGAVSKVAFGKDIQPAGLLWVP